MEQDAEVKASAYVSQVRALVYLIPSECLLQG